MQEIHQCNFLFPTLILLHLKNYSRFYKKLADNSLQGNRFRRGCWLALIIIDTSNNSPYRDKSQKRETSECEASEVLFYLIFVFLVLSDIFEKHDCRISSNKH